MWTFEVDSFSFRFSPNNNCRMAKILYRQYHILQKALKKKCHASYNINHRNQRKTCRATPSIYVPFEPTLITWLFDNWRWSYYLDHMIAKKGEGWIALNAMFFDSMNMLYYFQILLLTFSDSYRLKCCSFLTLLNVLIFVEQWIDKLVVYLNKFWFACLKIKIWRS